MTMSTFLWAIITSSTSKLEKVVYVACFQLILRLYKLGYDPFKLHIHNRFVTNFPCQVCIKVTIINFTVTKSGLEDQILR